MNSLRHQQINIESLREFEQATPPVNAPNCLCRSQNQRSILPCMVTFYQTILEREIPHVDRLLLRKQGQLERLELIPAYDLTQKQFQYMEALREEIKIIAGIFITLEHLRMAYMEETGTMAGQYWELWIENRFQQQLISELQHELAKSRKEADDWFDILHKSIKSQLNRDA